MSELPTMALNITNRWRERIRDGATHVAVSVSDFGTHAVGNVFMAGDEEECEAACGPKLIIRFDGDTSDKSQVVWEAGEILALLEDDADEMDEARREIQRGEIVAGLSLLENAARITRENTAKLAALDAAGKETNEVRGT